MRAVRVGRAMATIVVKHMRIVLMGIVVRAGLDTLVVLELNVLM